MRVPYVLIELPLAAISGGPECRVRVSSPVAGRTLTSGVDQELLFGDGITQVKEALILASRYDH